MTGNKLRTENYKADHSTYSGEISIEDFDTLSPNKKRIINQIDAENLRDELKKNKEMKEIVNRYTLEELREMKLVSNTNGRPTSNLTDEKWQKEFRLRKLFITPHNPDVKKLTGRYARESGILTENSSTYHGPTNWQTYCLYINDVLSNIRMGQVDYCYYIFQIMELARFHYDTLKTKYCDGYWEVWLKR